MIAQKDPCIESAYRKLQPISQDKDKRLEYEAREKAIRDYNAGMLEAEKRGEERGENRINRLNSLLIQGGRLDDLKRSTSDKSFQMELMAEYRIWES